VAGMILAPRFPFPHSFVSLVFMSVQKAEVVEVNVITHAGILTGGCLGLLYGLLAGRPWAMAVGLALGGACGYVLGLESLSAFKPLSDSYCWRYDGALHFAWQGALAMLWLHLGAGLGAVLGAGPAAAVPANPKSKIQNPKS